MQGLFHEHSRALTTTTENQSAMGDGLQQGGGERLEEYWLQRVTGLS